MASICDSETTVMRWGNTTKVLPDVDGAKYTISKVGEEVRYSIELTPQCAGRAKMYAYDLGRRVGTDSGPAPQVEWIADINDFLQGNHGGADDASGASLRVNIDGVEVCRANDGNLRLDESWAFHHTFDNFNLYCQLPGDAPFVRDVAAGQKIVFEAFRWNKNAISNPDGFAFVVAFERA